MTAEAITTKAAVWKLISELGHDEALKRLSIPAIKVSFADTERMRTIADTLDHEIDSWAVGFAKLVNGQWVFPNDAENQHAHTHVIKLESASRFLRNFSVRLDRKLNPFDPNNR